MDTERRYLGFKPTTSKLPTHVRKLHPVVHERHVDGGPAEHEDDGVDELQLGAGDDGRDHQEHGDNQDDHRDEDRNLGPVKKLALTQTLERFDSLHNKLKTFLNIGCRCVGVGAA